LLSLEIIDITSERSIENGSAKTRFGANKVISEISSLFIFKDLFVWKKGSTPFDYNYMHLKNTFDFKLVLP